MTPGALVDAIACLLTEHPDGITSGELAEWAVVSTESAANALYRQYGAGRLVRELAPPAGRGRRAWRYRAAP